MDTITTARRLIGGRTAALTVLITGLACLPFWHFPGHYLPRMYGFMLVLTLASLLATLAVLFRENHLRTGDRTIARRVALGLSWRVVLLGGAMVVVAHAFYAGRKIEFGVSWIVFVQLALILIPVAFLCQLSTSLIVGLVESPQATAQTAPEPAEGRPRMHKLFWVIYGIALAGFLAPAIGWLPEPKSKPKGVAESNDPEPAKPKIEPFAPPAGIAHADPTRFEFSTSRGLSDVSGQPRGAFAPDSNQFAYTIHDGRTLRVFDTNTFKQLGSFQLSSTMNHVCWSPDSKRIFYIDRAGAAGVIDVAKSRVHPLAASDTLPNRPPSWWEDNQIAFAPSSPDMQPVTLDLDTLKLSSSANPARWASMPGRVREEWSQTGILRETPAGQRTALVIASHPSSYSVGSRQGGYVQEDRDLSLQAMDQQFYFSRAFPGYSPRDGLILPAPDSSRVALLSGNGSEISYLKLIPGRLGSYRFQLPEKSQALTTAAEKRGLFAYVCRPQVNSLNGKTVGPKRQELSGVVMIKRVEGTEALAITSMEVRQFLKGDVICDLHATLEDGKKLFDQGAFENWWTPLPELDTIEGPPRRDSEAVVPLTEGDLKDPGSAVRNFIVQHHTRAVGDIRDYVAGFASQVDYYGQGMVSRSKIETDQIAYRKKFSQMREWVDGEVKLVRLSSDTYKATYTIQIDHSQRTGNFGTKSYRGSVTLESTVSLRFGTPQVVVVREISRNLNN